MEEKEDSRRTKGERKMRTNATRERGVQREKRKGRTQSERERGGQRATEKEENKLRKRKRK